jgi:hypothetical protein
MIVFEVGATYVAAPALEGARKRLAVVIGREGDAVQLAFINELALARLQVVNGREILTCDTELGYYSLSSAVPAAASDAAIVNDILAEKNKEVEDGSDPE